MDKPSQIIKLDTNSEHKAAPAAQKSARAAVPMMKEAKSNRAAVPPPVPNKSPSRVTTEPEADGTREAIAAKPDESPNAQKPIGVDNKKSDSSHRHAFVIEDDFDASEIFGKAMEANGLSFEVINTGSLAIERLNQVAPDIVILDMHLPNVDGTQILAHIRKTDRLAKTLVIVVTADARVGDVVKGDADLVVLKPATYTQVRDFASRLLRRSAAAAS